jgi:hypothetical protein
MRAALRLSLAGLASLALLAGALASADPPGESRPGPLPEELASLLEARSAQYDGRALRFQSLERSRAVRYRRGEAVREKGKSERYLLVRDEEGLVYRELRGRPGSRGGLSDKPRFDFPTPYAWTQLFEPRLRSSFRFRVGEPETTPWRLARPIDFEAAAPVMEGRRITEWSGTAWVEVKTGNLLRVVARPNLQDERLPAAFDRWIRSFNLIGFHLAPTPLGLELEVRFDREHEGFLYPSRVEMRTFRLVARNRAVTVSRQVVDHTRYEFFRSDARDDLEERSLD